MRRDEMKEIQASFVEYCGSPKASQPLRPSATQR
jgi:hypothetical protein